MSPATLPVAQSTHAALRAPRNDQPSEMRRAGIEPLEEPDGGPRRLARCLCCGEAWVLPTFDNGRLRPGWWACPRRCNAQAAPVPASAARRARIEAARLRHEAERQRHAAAIRAVEAATAV